MLMIVALSTLLAAANAGLLPATVQHTQLLHAATPIAYTHTPTHTLHTVDTEPHSPAHYDFSYSVNDPQTGDVKAQHESRQGDNVQGEYSLVEPDGQRRTVQYTADAVNGFNAVVLRDGLSQHGSATPVQHTIAAAAPLPTVTLAHRAAIATPLTQITHHHAPAATLSYAPAKYAVAPQLTTTTYHAQPQPIAAAPIAYTTTHHAAAAAPLHATTTYHAAAAPQPQQITTYTSQAAPIAYAQQPAAVAYTQHHLAAPAPAAIAYAQQPAAVAYTQHHLAAPAPAAIAYTQQQHVATAPVALATSHASVTHHGLSYSY